MHIVDCLSAVWASIASNLYLLRTAEAALHVTARKEHRVYRIDQTYTAFIFGFSYRLNVVRLHVIVTLVFVRANEADVLTKITLFALALLTVKD